MRTPTEFNSTDLLSDHAYQSILVQEMDFYSQTEVYKLAAGSYNMQDLCISLAENTKRGKPFANSPFTDYDEPLNKYKARKMAQISFIIDMIHKGEEVVFLQEVDFLIKSRNPQEDAVRQELRDTLNQALKDVNCAIAITPVSTKGVANQKMATVYRSDKFQVQSAQGVFPTDITSKFRQNRGFELLLQEIERDRQGRIILKRKGKTIVATNLHLAYGKDYGDVIYDYQLEQCHQGRLCVLGGDTNNIQNENLKTALGDWHHATNFSRDPSTRQLTTQHAPKQQKAYDRLFAGPSSATNYVQVDRTDRNQEVSVDTNGVHFLPFVSEGRLSRSRAGEPWRRGRDILNELVSTYRANPSPAIIDEIRACMRWKDLQQDLLPQDIRSAIFPQQGVPASTAPSRPSASAQATAVRQTAIPYLIVNGMKIAPFESPDIEPYGAFANTTKGDQYSVEQTVDFNGGSYTYTWPSSEHAYHAQKIIYLIKNNRKLTPNQQQGLIKKLRTIEHDTAPGQAYSPNRYRDWVTQNIIPSLFPGMTLNDFNKLCGIQHRESFMQTVIQLKLEQHANLKQLAMACAAEGVIPVELSRRDDFWASGAGGMGTNMLGLIIYQEGRRLLAAQGQLADDQSYTPSASLAHDAFVAKLNPATWRSTVPSVSQNPINPTLKANSHAVGQSNFAPEQTKFNALLNELQSLVDEWSRSPHGDFEKSAQQISNMKSQFELAGNRFFDHAHIQKPKKLQKLCKVFKQESEAICRHAEKTFAPDIWRDSIKPFLKGVLGVLVGIFAVVFYWVRPSVWNSYVDTFFKPESATVISQQWKSRIFEQKFKEITRDIEEKIASPKPRRG